MGAKGRPVSIVISSAFASLVALPAASVTVAATCIVPSGSGATGVRLHWPASLIVRLPISVLYVTPATTTSSVSPSAKVTVPVISGVVLPVASALTVGAVGGVVSMVTVPVTPMTVELPSTSMMVAMTGRSPSISASAASGVRLQLPSASIVRLPLATL